MRTLQRTGSLKSSGKTRPPPYRPPSDVLRTPSSNMAQISSDTAVSRPSESVCEIEKSDRNPAENYIRGIPTAEIIGSSENELIKSESKSEPSKRVSRLPRVLSNRVQRLKTDDNNQESTALGRASPQAQPRRNSLERPSYYNSLYKAGKSPYSGPMTKSLILSGNSEFTSNTSASTTGSNNFQKYRSCSRMGNGDNNSSEYEYHAVRPCSSLGRTLSYKSPSPTSVVNKKINEKWDTENKAEVKHNAGSSTNIARVSSLRKGNLYSSRLLRPQSLYGGTDLNYQLTESEKQDLEKNSSLNNRKSPVYQRSISLFEGGKSDEYQKSLIKTPDRSVLGKFLTDRRDSESQETIKDSSNEKSKTRKISRFLRPDFYDTPKEDSVYEKKDDIKNNLNGQIWKEKSKSSSVTQKKTCKTPKGDYDAKTQENRLSIVDRAIKSLKHSSLKKVERDSMSRESNLIKRAVSLEDCSLVPENRNRRASSLTPVSSQSNYKNIISSNKYEKLFQRKKGENVKNSADEKLNKNKDLRSDNMLKQESMIKKMVRKLSPKNFVKPKLISSQEEKSTCNGIERTFENNALEDIGDSRSRLSRIAGLKRLEFSRPAYSADSTPSMEDSKISGELDDSSSFLSPTEDGSDTWSISSDYTDAREYNAPLTNADESVSERIRRKSFYSRFNQSKRRKSSQSSQLSGSRTRLPMYSKSMSSDFSDMNMSTLQKKKSDSETPV